MTRRYFVTDPDGERAVTVEESTRGHFRVRIDAGEAIDVELFAEGAVTTLRANGRVISLIRAENGVVVGERTRERVSVSVRSAQALRRGTGAADTGGLVRSPMPGRVLKVLVAVGANVSAGTPVVVIEAMKMENELGAGRAGVVKRVHVNAGDAVERDAQLLEIE